MTWTYSVEGIANSPLFQVRYLIGDTMMNDQQAQDEEINFALTQRPSIYGAAAMVSRSLAGKFSRLVDTVAKDLRTTLSTKARNYLRMAMEFETQAAVRSGAMPYAGGISLSDKARQEQDSDRVPPQFDLGMQDNSLPVGAAGNETQSETDEVGLGPEV